MSELKAEQTIPPTPPQKICVRCGVKIKEKWTPDLDGKYYCNNCIDRGDYCFHYHGHPVRNRLNFTRTGKNNLFLGIELEVSNGRQHLPPLVAKATMELANDLLFLETDSSLKPIGIENVFHPMTITTLMNNKERLESYFKTLVRYGYRSHDTDCCGLHIHVDQSLLNEYTILNLFEFVSKNIKALEDFGRRRFNNYCRPFKFNHDLAKEKENYKDSTEKEPITTTKYLAVSRKQRTIEFRFFKGTLRPISFFASAQFIHNLVELCYVGESILPTFEEVILHNSFPELLEYARDKGYIAKEGE